jgi:hypothetical protein
MSDSPLKNRIGPDPLTRDLTPFRIRLGTAAFKISEKVGSQYRGPIDRLLTKFSSANADTGESLFPWPLRRHVANNDRTTSNDWSQALYFTVANAIFTFYDAVLGRTEPNIADAATLERRIKLVEEVAAFGPSSFMVRGSDALGWYMIHKESKPVPFLRPGGRNTETDTDVENGAD